MVVSLSDAENGRARVFVVFLATAPTIRFRVRTEFGVRRVSGTHKRLNDSPPPPVESVRRVFGGIRRGRSR